VSCRESDEASRRALRTTTLRVPSAYGAAWRPTPIVEWSLIDADKQSSPLPFPTPFLRKRHARPRYGVTRGRLVFFDPERYLRYCFAGVGVAATAYETTTSSASAPLRSEQSCEAHIDASNGRYPRITILGPGNRRPYGIQGH
jgi:hypothetical protein